MKVRGPDRSRQGVCGELMLGRDRDEEKEEETEADGEAGSSEAKRAREMRNGEQDRALGRDGVPA